MGNDGSYLSPHGVLASCWLPWSPSFLRGSLPCGSCKHTQKNLLEYIFSHWVQAMRTFSSCLACAHIKMQRPTCRLNKLINAISYSSSPVWHLITHTCAMLECWREIFFFCEPHLSRRPANPILWLPNTHTHKHAITYRHLHSSLSLKCNLDKLNLKH